MPHQQFGPKWLKSNLSSLPDHNLLRCYSLYLAPFGQKSKNKVTNTIRNILESQVLPTCDELDKKWSKYHFILRMKPIFFLYKQTLVQQPHSEKIARDHGTIYGFHTKNSENQKTTTKIKKLSSSRGKFTPFSASLSVCRFGCNWHFCCFLTEKSC